MEVSPFIRGDSTESNFLSIDMVVRKTMTAIEFDGPAHFLSNGKHNGTTEMKTRLLRLLGWTVVRIPCYEWNALHEDAKLPYLKEALNISV